VNTPILFLVFNRPGLTQIVFDAIKLAKPDKLFIAIDGPRQCNSDDIIKIDKVLSIFNSINWNCKVEFLKRDKNLGTGLAVSSAIDWFFTHVDEGIILEDDCVPSPDFFEFCSEMLIKYRYNFKVMAVNGSNPCPKLDMINSYTFVSYNLIWGWATWKRAWEHNIFDLSNSTKLYRLLFLIKKFKFDLISVRSWHKHINLAIENRVINTWDYQWIFACFKENGMIIIPKVNLIKNLGNTEDPTHGINQSYYLGLETEKLNFPLCHPPLIKFDNYLENEIKIKRFGNTFGQFFKMKVKKMLSKIKK
jgi:hypothetical protein